MSTLRLTLKKKPFEVMVTGEKKEEFRANTPWIYSRLFDKNGNPRHYDQIEYVNGYGANRPRFVTDFCGFEMVNGVDQKYSNGLHVKTQEPTFVIRHTRVLKKSFIGELK